MPDASVRRSLATMSPRGRELLRRYLIADQPDRDELAGYRNPGGSACVAKAAPAS
jgi:hypothetical protein